METIRWVIEEYDAQGQHQGYFRRFDTKFMGGGHANGSILICRKFSTPAEAAEVVRNILAVEHPAPSTPPVLNIVQRDIGPKPYSVNVHVPYVDWTDHIDDWEPNRSDVVVQFPDDSFSLDDFLRVCREPWFAANPDCDPATVQWERSTFSINWPPGTPWHQKY